MLFSRQQTFTSMFVSRSQNVNIGNVIIIRDMYQGMWPGHQLIGRARPIEVIECFLKFRL